MYVHGAYKSFLAFQDVSLGGVLNSWETSSLHCSDTQDAACSAGLILACLSL